MNRDFLSTSWYKKMKTYVATKIDVHPFLLELKDINYILYNGEGKKQLTE